MSQSSDLIKTPTFNEVKSSYTEMNDAILGHTKWLTEWNTRIICGIPVEEKYTSENSHRNCYFGRWFYGKHANFLLHKPEFVAIKEQHRMVHKRMGAVVIKSNSDEPITRTEYEHFIESEASFSESLINLRDELYKLLLSFDFLTGTFNRQAFFHILEQEYARVTRFNEPGCIVLLDIDNFKNINDTFGHTGGDKALIAIASFITENMRPYDFICRYGGEEFLICMPKITIEMSYSIVDRIREDLSKKKISVSDDDYINVTASFGISLMSAEEELNDTIEHADKALYQAKTNGRNKVEVWAGNR